MFENVRRFLSPINQAVIVFQIEHELAMGGPLFGRVSLLFENQDPIKINGIFDEHVLWQIDGQYVALARWPDMKSKYLRQKLCVIDAPNLQTADQVAWHPRLPGGQPDDLRGGRRDEELQHVERAAPQPAASVNVEKTPYEGRFLFKFLL